MFLSNRIIPLFLVLIFTSCVGQSFNSNTEDFNLVASDFCTGSDASNSLLCAANEILQTKCVNCHTGYHNAWASYSTNAEWINDSSAGIVQGDSSDSELIKKLKGEGGNMPEASSTLPFDERQALKDWIDSL